MRLLTALFLLAAASQETVAPKDTWNQFRGSPMRTGRSAAEIPDALTLLWSFEAGFSIDSSVAIVDDVVYMTALPGLVAALALDDGAVRWKRDFGEEEDRFGESSPTVVDGTVYVGDLLGVVHAFDAANGETRWTFETGAEIKASPVVIGDHVLVASYDEHLYALDPKTGELQWTFESLGPLHSTPGYDGELVYVTGCDALLRGIDLEDGAEKLQMVVLAITLSDSGLDRPGSQRWRDRLLVYVQSHVSAILFHDLSSLIMALSLLARSSKA